MRTGQRLVGQHAALLDAARAVFAERGYDGATVRAIAERAGVDAAMVNHWFGGKEGLFVAALDLPADPGAVLAEAGLAPPAERAFRSTGKAGRHSEHLGYILAEMQYLQRSFPGGVW